MKQVQTLVIGAGPTGLGAAWRLHERGETDWLVLEQADGPGGAAASVVDDHGFTWDLGGHVIHSHYQYFDQALASSGVEWVYPQRNGFVWLEDRFVPVPVQQNLGSLPPALRARVQAELTGTTTGSDSSAPDLERWFRATFGSSLSASFFEPFNGKMWAHPSRALEHGWTSQRSGSSMSNVPQPSLSGGVVQDQSRFPYPRYGSGALWSALAACLPADRLRYGAVVVDVDPDARMVQLATGERLCYQNLVSTMPLTHLLATLEPTRSRAELLHSSVEVIGLGFEGPPPAALAGTSWVYHPDPEVPFHRATVLSNYSPELAGPGRWSVLLECGTSAHRPLDADQIVQQSLAVLQTWGAGEPVSIWQRYLPMGYPVPSLNRDQVLAPLMAELEALGVRSRGRFGGWRYESCNQDYAFMQGVQAVDAITDGTPEDVFWAARPLGPALCQPNPCELTPPSAPPTHPVRLARTHSRRTPAGPEPELAVPVPSRCPSPDSGVH